MGRGPRGRILVGTEGSHCRKRHFAAKPTLPQREIFSVTSLAFFAVLNNGSGSKSDLFDDVESYFTRPVKTPSDGILYIGEEN